MDSPKGRATNLVIGTLHHKWAPFALTRDAVAQLGLPFIVVDSSPGLVTEPYGHETWIRVEADRYYPLVLFKELIASAAVLDATVLLIEADILLDRPTITHVSTLPHDCYFLYEESTPAMTKPTNVNAQ